MKRILVLFLLFALPLQATWAAASAYCRHEQGSAAQHFGHHSHQHQAGDNDVRGVPASGFDADCGYCHLGGVAVATPFVVLSLTSPDAPAVSFFPSSPPSVFLEGPERPKWASAV